MPRLTVFAGFVLILSSQALADQLSLKNGDRLSGTIVKSDGKTVVLHTDYAGDLSLKWDAVQAIQSSQPLHVEMQDGKTVVGSVTSSGDELQIATTSGTVEAQKSSIKNLRSDAEEWRECAAAGRCMMHNVKDGRRVLTRQSEHLAGLSHGCIYLEQRNGTFHIFALRIDEVIKAGWCTARLLSRKWIKNVTIGVGEGTTDPVRDVQPALGVPEAAD